MKIKVKKLHPDAQLPTYAHEGDVGADLYSLETVELYPGNTILVRTGIAIAPEEFCDIQVRSRSGLATKSISVLNSPGTIDSGYRSEIKVILHNHHQHQLYTPYLINKGDRIAQLVVHPQLRPEFVEVEELDETDRGSGGFGSTGK